MGFIFDELNLKDAYLITNFHSGDSRGSFSKTFEMDVFREAGIFFSHNETFVTTSSKNVIRGLHFQINNPQAKIVTVVSGSVWDVIVDLRPESSTFKKWYAQVLSSENHLSFFVPKGFAHGFLSMEDNTVMLYQCDGKYDPKTDTGIRFDDSDIGIEWPVDLSKTIHSSRDLELGSFKDYIKNPMMV